MGEFRGGFSEFLFPNGDKYTGDFCAHVSGLAWRQGSGAYSTHDGQIYEGQWKDDKLNEAENIKITFQNSDQYLGRIHKYRYNGIGSYYFGNNKRLTCNFIANKPTGDVIFLDNRDELWYGKANYNENVLLFREHIFSYELDENRGKGKPKFPEKAIVEEEEDKDDEKSESIDSKEMKQIIFSKSFKTASDIDFEDSDWIEEYKNNQQMRHTILNKIKTTGRLSLNDDEKNWYREYRKTAKILEERREKKLKKIPKDTLRHYFDEKLLDTCPPQCTFDSNCCQE